MAQLLDNLLIQKSDFTLFRDISKNIDEDKVNIFIREAQTVEVRGFLGHELWAAMQSDWQTGTNDFAEARFNDLWFGTEYTNQDGKLIRFNGYKSAAVYFAYRRFLDQQQVNVSRFGVESVQNEISEDVSNATIRSKSKDALQMAFAYQKDAETFLYDKKDSYTEWRDANDKTPQKTSLSFFKV